ncbi:hypothetical protein BH09ACT4_BH09ACT4_03910 [soil metagenome]
MIEDQDHPTPHDKVAHFMATVEDYEAMSETMPLPRTVKLAASQDPETRWTIVLHALMLRKYFQPKDQLQLSAVVDALVECVLPTADQAAADDWREARGLVEVMQNVTTTNWGAGDFTDAELLRHVIYGRYLHGDFGKWAATEDTPAIASERGVWDATVSRADRVLSVAAYIRQDVEFGALDYESGRTFRPRTWPGHVDR